VANYLTGNVLADLPERLNAFVRRTCVLGLLTAPLCDRLLELRSTEIAGSDASAAQLTRVSLERNYGSAPRPARPHR
jgi:ATP/maltotriose-dependent transcriptional regulator MalT